MSQQLHKHSLNELRGILKLLWSDPSLPAALLIGPPGCGKSTMIADLAREMDMHCETLMANIREPSDFAGLPVVHLEAVHMMPLEWAKRIANTNCVLFLDEINTARPATISALLRVVLDRMVGDVPLGPGVRIVAAMNPAEESAHGWELPPALANRFYHFAVQDTSVHDWKAWARSQSPEPALASLIDRFAMDTLHNTPGSGPFASPRSWYAALRGAAAAQRAGSPDLAAAIVAGAVGVGNAAAWAASADSVVDWTRPQSAAIVSREIKLCISAVRAGTQTEEMMWELLELAGRNNIAATYATIGSERKYLQTISMTPRAETVWNMIYAAAKSEGVVKKDTPA